GTTSETAPEDSAYGPLGGTEELRAAIAAHYNRLYRVGKKSQYKSSNVCVAQGGRLALTRAFSALGHANLGYQIPDYTAYEDMFDLHLARLTPIPIRAREEDGFLVPAARLAPESEEPGIRGVVFDTPC